jgi:hypothetical protein
MKKTILTTALAFASLTFAVQASAAEPDEQAKQEARDLMAQGRKARDTADLRAALSAFSKADEIMHVPTTGLEVAKTLAAMGRLVEATSAAERVAALPQTPDEPEAFGKAREAAKELQRELDARTPRIHVNGVDSQARLELDGMPLEPSGGSDGMRVNPGRHVLVAHQGGSKQSKAVEVGEAAGTVEVGFDFGTAAPAPALAAAEPEPAPRRSSKTRSSTIAIYSLGAVAVVGVGTGVGLGLAANKRKSDLEDSCKPNCKTPAVEQLRTTYVLANVAAGVGLAAAAAAVTIYLTRPSDAELRARQRQAAITSLSLSASVGTAPGVSLAGAF